jgi:hypothetical protein
MFVLPPRAWPCMQMESSAVSRLVCEKKDEENSSKSQVKVKSADTRLQKSSISGTGGPPLGR